MRPAIMAALPKMGLNRNFPRKVLYGPKEYQGIGITHLFTMQSYQHLKDIIEYQLNLNLIQDLHQGTFKSLFLQIGLGKDFLTTPLPGVEEEIPRTIAKCV